MPKRLSWLPLLAALASPVLAAVPEEWRQSAYAYEASQVPLDTVLGDFARSFGVSLEMEGVEGVVNAKIRAASAEEFLDRLGLEHQFQWFLYNGMLHVSPQAAQQSRRLEISADAAPDLKQALTDIGLLDPRFGWGELPDEGVVLVSGPPAYVELIRGFSQEKAKADEKQQVMSFPLRYAAVSDRQIQYREQRVVIPGVASMLDGLLGGGRPATPAPEDPQANIEALQDMTERARSKIINLAGDRVSKRTPAGGGSGSASRRVAADTRNNAVLIYDDPGKREVYAELVERLDVPRNLVEIDAIILDIDRSQLSRLESRWGARAGSVSAGSSLLSGSSTLFISDFERFFADIQAIEGQGMASVIARPSVLTLENQPALVDFSRTAYIATTGERVASVQPVTAGTSLQVIPRTIPGDELNRFQLIIDIEDGQLEEPGQNGLPGVRKGNVSTQAVIGENRSLVVGGFHVDESGDREERIPVLGTLPVVGPLFSSTRREVSRRERLFIITPRLIGDQVDPSRYVASDNRGQLARALAKAKDPGQPPRARLREAIARALAGLARGEVANDLSPGAGLALSALCKPKAGLSIDDSRGQWFEHPEFSVSIGVLRNTSDRPQRFDPSSCGGSRILAVSLIPKASLQPGEAAEVFVVQGLAATLAPARGSLLRP